MPIFVFLCLVLAAIVQISSPLKALLISDVFIYGGLVIASVAILGSLTKKLPETLSYDVFASGILLTWCAYWKPLFVKDSPIFFFFPVYFALIIAFITIFFIQQRHKIDRDSLIIMQNIVNSGVIQPWVVMTCVVITLYFEDHFLQFPVFITLLAMRYALTGCLKPK